MNSSSQKNEQLFTVVSSRFILTVGHPLASFLPMHVYLSLTMATYTQSRETPEYRIFREYYDRLVTAIQDPLLLATRLFARSIIDSTVKEQMSVLGLSRVHKNNALLSAVEMQIGTSQRTFDVFLSALKEDSSMQSLVESMQSK